MTPTVVISQSKLNRYQYDLLYVHIIISSHSGIVFFCEVRKTHSVSFVIASLSRHTGYDTFYTTSVSYFTVTDQLATTYTVTVHYTFFLFYGNPIQPIVWALFSACGVSTWALFLLDSVECSELCFYARGSCFTNIWLLLNYFATIIYNHLQSFTLLLEMLGLENPQRHQSEQQWSFHTVNSKTSTAQLNCLFCFEVWLLVVVDCSRGISPSFISFNSFPQF